ncbi:hypothetical protein KIPB_011486 [Kipferlia bialata]|uniref:Rubisco LSMT substrate-binding domain-containing protein n=1 Tax=Kipferlia bialata TaxID=797122 RepID=A0A9K3D4X3_9EUKA|nr:hypothetical protein KIPB_011486 [Kipferlia bialata]|eukprot:g11486.t1
MYKLALLAVVALVCALTVEELPAHYLEEYGMDVSDFTISPANLVGFSVASTKDIAEGELICSVPLEHVASPATMLRDSPLAPHEELFEEVSGLYWMALSLASTFAASIEDEEAENAYEYLRGIVPPYMWPEESLKPLVGSNVFSTLLLEKGVLQRDYDFLVEHFAGTEMEKVMDTIDFGTFVWAMQAVRSHFVTASTGEVSVPVLVPFLSLLTQSMRSNVITETEDGMINLIASRDIQEGDMLSYEFARLSNADHFAIFGFSPLEDTEQQYIVNLTFDAETPLGKAKQETLEAMGLRNLSFGVSGKAPLSPLFLAAMRISLAEEDEVELLPVAAAGGRISLLNEKRVMSSLARTLVARLEATDDEQTLLAVLQDPEVSQPEREASFAALQDRQAAKVGG